MKRNFLMVTFLSLLSFYVQASFLLTESEKSKDETTQQLERINLFKKAVADADQAKSMEIISFMKSDFEITLARHFIKEEIKKSKDIFKPQSVAEPLRGSNSLEDFDLLGEKDISFNLENLLPLIEEQSRERITELQRLKSQNESTQGAVVSFLGAFLGINKT